MPAKLWQPEEIRNHLLAALVGVQVSVPAWLMKDNEYSTAYYRGNEAVVKYLAEKFGLNLDSTQPARKNQAAELRLKTWSRADVKRHLEVAWRVMLNHPSFAIEPDTRLTAYYQGIEKTLLDLVLSFGIEGFAPRGNKGSGH